ncbi:hypothetical protein [Hymenobacter jejuensis]|uniref:Right-handed parallel beta-helix repeat-containing protein n=1 Tax=Hymenobacter jejuensis TaxID=2502781 RepID=A0A5B7ZZ91_9BACT|nr:hypothetical protein [Hymenobacter jejuensis]QDA60179.1 hypothetical protein FHG12_08685 [Hymenobacter jejuensis]
MNPMRLLLPVLSIFLCISSLLVGCEPKEDVITTSASAKLEFSSDTVKFDTVFVQKGTVTKRLWVYNRNARAVKVEQISLGTPANSPYTLTLNGEAGVGASNVEIRGKDSVLVLVRAAIDPTAGDGKPFLIEDQVRFRTNGNEQSVRLIAYGQNAYFHDGETLPCDAVWRNDKPHVIYNSVLVGPNCTLTIEPGTRVYSHANSAIVVQGRLLVNANFNPGTATVKATDRNIVRFAADRLEPFYNEIPGQWRGIQFDASSHDNVVRYAEIKNASFGLLVYNPQNLQPRPRVTVENTVIKNISGAALTFASGGQNFTGGGILSFSGDFSLTNCLITNCGEYAVLSIGSGLFGMNFCTVANFTPSFKRDSPSMAFTDDFATPQAARQPTVVDIRNSIVWGNTFANGLLLKDELLFKFKPGNIQRNLVNNLIRTDLYKEYQLPNQSNNESNYPKFKRPAGVGYSDKFDYQLDTLSPASNKRYATPFVSRDLLNVARDPSSPDLGAYERLNP